MRWFVWPVAAFMSVAACGNNEARYDVVGDTIPKPLQGLSGDAAQGRIVFVERSRGHCILCHKITELDEEFQGNVGPNLSDVGARLNPSQLRLRIVDPAIVNPETTMPPYYRTTGRQQVANEFKGKPVLSAQDIEDLIAYLSELKG